MDAMQVGRPEPSARPGSMPGLLVVALLATVVMTVNLGGRASLDGHEVLVAQTAKEMLDTGDWLLPRFSGAIRLQKPPLSYWLAAGSYKMTGEISEFAARLPSAIFAITTVVLVSRIGARRYGESIGLLAGIIQLSTYWAIAYGKSATIDSTLTFLVAAAIVAGTPGHWGDERSRSSWTWLCVCTLSGLAVLAKGPVALVIIVPTIVMARFIRPRSETPALPRSNWAIVLGTAIFGLLSLGWPVVIALQAPDAWTLWWGQSGERFLYHYGAQTRAWWFYFSMVPLFTLPWSGAWLFEMGAAISDWRKGRPVDNTRRVLWLWFAVALVFFTLSAGKREHYILPGLPPLSLLAALGLQRAFVAIRAAARFAVPIRVLLGTLAVAGTVAGFIVETNYQSMELGTAIAGLSLATVLCLWMLLRWIELGFHQAALRNTIAWGLMIILIVEIILAPTCRFKSAAIGLIERNRGSIDAAGLVIHYGDNDRWSTFTLGRPVKYAESAPDLAALLGGAENAVILAPVNCTREIEWVAPVEIIDRVIAEERGLREFGPSGDLVLLRLTPPAVAGRATSSQR